MTRKTNRRTLEEQQEWEASYFAMHLLVPTDMLRRDLDKLGGFDIENDPRLAGLANKYQVSLQVMLFRIHEELNR